MEDFLDKLDPRSLSELQEAITNNLFSEKLEGLSSDEIDRLQDLLDTDPYVSMIDSYNRAFADNEEE